MKLHNIIVIFLTLISLLFLMSCSGNKPVQTTSTAPTNTTSYTPLEVPAWLCDIPEGNCAIGIAWDDQYRPESSLNSAKEFAAISLSRNHSAFVVDKTAVINFAQQTDTDIGKADFNVVVSADTSYLNQAYREMDKLADTSLNGYKMCLFSESKCPVNSATIRLTPADKPAWVAANNITEDNGYIHSVGYAQAANLIEAWKLAQEDALRQLAKYRLMNVIATIRSSNDDIQKSLALETVTQNPDTYLEKSWFYQRKVDLAASYAVYILIKMKKGS